MTCVDAENRPVAQGSGPVFVPPHVEAMGSLNKVARLADALQAVDIKLAWAIKNSRDCCLPGLEQSLLDLQRQLDGLVARLQPAVLFQHQPSV